MATAKLAIINQVLPLGYTNSIYQLSVISYQLLSAC